MAWTDLTFAFGSILTSSKMTQLDDNLDALANGDSGAPRIQTAAIADSAITSAKYANGSIQNAHIDTRTISGNRLQTNTISATEIGANSINQSELSSGAVARTHLDTGTGSTSGLIDSGQSINITLNSYALFPMIYSEGAALRAHGTDGGSADAPRFRINNDGPNDNNSYVIDHRFIAS